MRKITAQAAAAFKSGTPFNSKNTAVVHTGTEWQLKLHGHVIAWRLTNATENVGFSLCGYNTMTTRDRLKAAGIRVSTKQGQASVYAVESLNSAGGFVRLEQPFNIESRARYTANLITGEIRI